MPFYSRIETNPAITFYVKLECVYIERNKGTVCYHAGTVLSVLNIEYTIEQFTVETYLTGNSEAWQVS